MHRRVRFAIDMRAKIDRVKAKGLGRAGVDVGRRLQVIGILDRLRARLFFHDVKGLP